jgi:hypothetical protein
VTGKNPPAPSDAPPVITDESQNASANPPPPPPVPPPPPPPEIEEVAAVLKGTPTKESVDAAYTSLARRHSLAVSEVARLQGGLDRLRAIAATTKAKRRDCFGQYDDSAPFCTATCRDPVCPSYTAETRVAREKSLQPVLDRQIEAMGETRESFAKHAATTMDEATLKDGTPVVVEG